MYFLSLKVSKDRGINKETDRHLSLSAYAMSFDSRLTNWFTLLEAESSVGSLSVLASIGNVSRLAE